MNNVYVIHIHRMPIDWPLRRDADAHQMEMKKSSRRRWAQQVNKFRF